MDKKYIVITLSVTGIGRKVHKHGEIVDEKGFPNGTIEGLVRGGYIKEYDPNAAENQVESPEEKAAFDELMALGKESLKISGVTAVYALAKMKADIAANAGSSDNGSGAGEGNPDSNAKKAYEDITSGDLKTYLTDNEVAFKASDDKKALYELYLAHTVAPKE